MITADQRGGVAPIYWNDANFNSLNQRLSLNPNAFLATGLNYVPFDGFHAILHQGERVLRANDARMMDATDQILSSLPSYGSNDGTRVLCDEIKRLRAELEQLRSEARQQARDAVRAAFESTDRAAEKITDGTKDAASKAAYAADRAKPKMN
jgi:hypothetical protein